MRRTRRTFFTLLAGALLIASSLPVQAAFAAGGGPKCYVKLNAGTLNSGNGGILSRALKNAKANDVFHIGGTCTANFLVPATTVTLVADLSGAVPADATTGTLSAGGKGTVLTVPSGATVTIRGLTIRDGAAPSGGGISNAGTLTITDGTVVTRNAATPNRSSSLSRGGGIANTGTLTIGGTATVRSNSALIHGGGIYNALDATATLEGDASVTDNSGGTANAADQGGGGVYSLGTLLIQGGASVARNSGRNGAGILASGSLVLRGNVQVSDNVASTVGGGVSSAGTLTIGDGVVISANRASRGAGIYVKTGSATIGGQAQIVDNSADTGGFGGGIAIDATTSTVSITDGVTVARNYASVVAGGIFNRGSLTLAGTVVTDNTAGLVAGGIQNKGTLTFLSSAVVSRNAAVSSGWNDDDGSFVISGGGVYNDAWDWIYFGEPFPIVHACSVIGLDSSSGTNNTPNDYTNYYGTWDTACP